MNRFQHSSLDLTEGKQRQELPSTAFVANGEGSCSHKTLFPFIMVKLERLM